MATLRLPLRRAARAPAAFESQLGQQADSRDRFRHFVPITTRWADNNACGHVNNVVHYSLFDTAVNLYLIEQDALDLHGSDVFGVVVEAGCRSHESLAYPEPIEVGLRVASLGRTSARWELGVFRPGADLAVAEGHFVHV